MLFYVAVPDVFPEFELRADEKYDQTYSQQFEQRQRSHWSTASFQKAPSTVGHRNVPNRRSMSILCETSTGNSVPLPMRRQNYGDKENQVPQLMKKPVEKAPAIPPR